MQTLSQSQLDAALAAADDADASPEERAEMLMEIAMGMQQRPKSAQQLHDAVALYDDPALGHPAKSAAGQSSSAGFAQYLAWHLSTPLDVHVSRGSGAEAAADWLKSRPEAEQGGRKVIVWVISDAAILR